MQQPQFCINELDAPKSWHIHRHHGAISLGSLGTALPLRALSRQPQARLDHRACHLCLRAVRHTGENVCYVVKDGPCECPRRAGALAWGVSDEHETGAQASLVPSATPGVGLRGPRASLAGSSEFPTVRSGTGKAGFQEGSGACPSALVPWAWGSWEHSGHFPVSPLRRQGTRCSLWL